MNRILWATLSLPLQVWIALIFVRMGAPIVAGLLMVVIAFLAAAAATKKMTPWDFIISTFHWGAIVLLIFGGAIVSAIAMVYYGGKMVISSLPWPLIALASGVYLIPLTLALAAVQFVQVDMSIFWTYVGVTYIALLVFVTWRSNK